MVRTIRALTFIANTAASAKRRKRAVENFSWKKITNDISGRYHRVCDGLEG